MKIIKNGKLEETEKVETSFNYSLEYASPCVWEGIRTYKQKDGSTLIFKSSEHIKRLFESAKIMNFKLPHSPEEVEAMLALLVKELGGGDLYIRPIAYSILDASSAKKREHQIQLDIYAFPLKTLHDRDKKIKVMISSFKRGYPQYQMQAKTPTNYHFVNTLRHEMELAGMDDMLLTDNDGYVTEATVANLFIIKDEIVFTPPNDGSILNGVTRKTIIQILISKGILVIEKRLTRADIYTADQVFICGTYAEVVEIGEVDNRIIENQGSKDILKLIKYEFDRITKG